MILTETEGDGMQKIKLVALVGATASGKSTAALELARRTGGEIVSCDSMQVYRGMDIATAKPTPAERAEVPHHLIDVADPETPYSVAAYLADAETAVREIAARGKLPIFCGGTGLYLDRFLFGGLPAQTLSDESLRAELLQKAEEKGNDWLHARLAEIDPESAAAIHKNNVRRVARAIEIYRLTGTPKSEWDRVTKTDACRYDACVVLLDRLREELYRRIDARVDQMIADGLLEETEALDRRGVFGTNATAAQAIGYKEILPFLHGECDLQTAVETLKIATRHYAKRQLTWFSAKPYVKPVPAADALLHLTEFLTKGEDSQ